MCTDNGSEGVLASDIGKEHERVVRMGREHAAGAENLDPNIFDTPFYWEYVTCLSHQHHTTTGISLAICGMYFLTLMASTLGAGGAAAGMTFLAITQSCRRCVEYYFQKDETLGIKKVSKYVRNRWGSGANTIREVWNQKTELIHAVRLYNTRLKQRNNAWNPAARGRKNFKKIVPSATVTDHPYFSVLRVALWITRALKSLLDVMQEAAVEARVNFKNYTQELRCHTSKWWADRCSGFFVIASPVQRVLLTALLSSAEVDTWIKEAAMRRPIVTVLRDLMSDDAQTRQSAAKALV
ncbi:unnamed protein product, partial [Amoebophrya sp. A25]|eukprot:GSA25T00026444001.1